MYGWVVVPVKPVFLLQFSPTHFHQWARQLGLRLKYKLIFEKKSKLFSRLYKRTIYYGFYFLIQVATVCFINSKCFIRSELSSREEGGKIDGGKENCGRAGALKREDEWGGLRMNEEGWGWMRRVEEEWGGLRRVEANWVILWRIEEGED